MADILNNDNEIPYWSHTNTPLDLVVIPSLPVECEEDFWRVPGLMHKEERHLWTTLLLQNPHARVIYLSSYALDAGVVQYYLSLLPPGTSLVPYDPQRVSVKYIPASATPSAPLTSSQTDIEVESPSSSLPHTATRSPLSDRDESLRSAISITEFIPDRFYNICMHDDGEASLAEKIEATPEKKANVIQAIRSLMRNHTLRQSDPRKERTTSSLLLCYRTSALEEQFAEELGLELMASPSKLDRYGSKSGSREIFEESGIPYLVGTPLVHSVRDLASGLRDLIKREQDRVRKENKQPLKGDLSKVVIKLDDFSAGGGNAVLDLSPILGDDGMTLPSVDDIEKHFEQLDAPYDDQKAADFLRFVPEIGAIVEKWAEVQKGAELTSPSVQSLITKSGKVQVISTHGQVLNKHEYAGGAFPAKTDRHMKLVEYAEKAGKVLAKKGVRGHYGIDFVEIRDDSTGLWQAYAIEINLRCTGTTGPYLALRLLAPGEYDFAKGIYNSKLGPKKYYVSTEGLKHDKLKGLKPVDFLAIQDSHECLRWNSKKQTGVLFHMLGAMKEFGKVGATCIADDDPAEAERMMEAVKQAIDVMH